MACGGCNRRKQIIKEIWHKYKRPNLPPGSTANFEGGIDKPVVRTVDQGRFRIHEVAGK